MRTPARASRSSFLDTRRSGQSCLSPDLLVTPIGLRVVCGGVCRDHSRRNTKVPRLSRARRALAFHASISK